MTVEWHQLALYALAYWAMVATPGPMVAAIAARSAAFGMKSAASLAVGAWVAENIWVITAIFGLALIAEHHGQALIVLRYIGAAWLIWLGARLVFGRSGVIRADDKLVRAEPFWHGVTTGALINLGNPKAALFFMTLFPGFFDMTVITWIDAVVIIAVSAPIGLGSDFLYAWLADRARRLIGTGGTARRIDQATGGILAGAGVAIAAA